MATGFLPFQGDTSAVVFDAILNRDPASLNELNPSLPAELARIIGQALEKDRDLRYQSATDLKTALKRLKRDLELGTTRDRRRNPPSRIDAGSFHRRSLFRKPERNERGRVPARRYHRGHHDGALEDQGTENFFTRHGAELSRQVGDGRTGWKGDWRVVCPHGQSSSGRHALAHQRSARRRGHGFPGLVRKI